MTALYLFLNYAIVFCCLGLAFFSAYTIIRQIRLHIARKGNAALPTWRPVLIVAHIAIMMASLLFVLISSVWLPRADYSAPAVNEAISRMNKEKLSDEKSMTVVPATDISTSAARELARDEEAQKIKDAFNELPAAD